MNRYILAFGYLAILDYREIEILISWNPETLEFQNLENLIYSNPKILRCYDTEILKS